MWHSMRLNHTPNENEKKIPSMLQVEHISDPDLNFWKNPDPDSVRMVWCISNVCKSMAEMGTEPDPDLESKIWRLTGFGAGFLVLDPDSESIFLTLPISAWKWFLHTSTEFELKKYTGRSFSSNEPLDNGYDVIVKAYQRYVYFHHNKHHLLSLSFIGQVRRSLLRNA